MKKFTLLIAMLFCFVAFGQKTVGTPTLEYPTKATQGVEKNQTVSKVDQQFASYNEISSDFVEAMRARAAVQNVKKVVTNRTSVPVKKLEDQSPLTQAAVNKYLELGSKPGSLSDYFTQEELELISAFYSSKKTSTVDSRIQEFTNTSVQRTVGECAISSPSPVSTVQNSPQFTSANRSAVTISHNVNTNPDLEILCTSVDTVADNVVWSEYDLDDDFGITADFEVTDVTISIRTGGTNGIPGAPEPTITVNIYSNDGVFPAGTQTLQGTATYTVTAADLDTIVTIPVTATIPFGDNLLYEIVVPDHNPNLGAFRFGVNDPGTGVDSWIVSNACGIATPTTLTAIGFPSVFIMSVIGDEAGGGGGGTPIVYGVNNATTEAISFDPAIPDVLNPTGGSSPAPTFEGGGALDPNNPTTAYGMDVGGELYSIDVATGTYTALGIVNQPGGETVSGMEFDPVSGTLYMLTTDIATSTLSTVDIGTLTSTPIAATGMAGGIGLAIDGAGNGWAYDIVDDNLYSVDLTTGAATLVGSIGFDANFGQGLCWDPNSDTIFMSAFNNGSFVGEWRSVDTATGNSTLIGVLGGTTPGGLNQVAWSSMPDVSGGGGSGCTAGIYADLPSLEAEFGGALPNTEDYQPAPAPGGVGTCIDPINSAGGDCYAAGDILDGIEIDRSAGDLVVIDAGFFGGNPILAGAATFADNTIINFPNNDVNSFGFNLWWPLAAGASDFEITVSGTSGVIDVFTVTVPNDTTPVFVGYIADEIVTSVEIGDSGNGFGDLVAAVSFGECSGGGGSTCGEITYENVSPTGGGVPAQNFPANPDFDSEAVDDVILPGPDAGQLCALTVTGAYSAGASGLPGDPNSSVTLKVYDDNGGVPGSVVYTEDFPGSVDADGDATFTLEPTGSPILNPNVTYWVSVAVNMEFATAGQWFWSSADDTQDAAGLWQNPNGGFGTCTAWDTFANCGVGGGLGPDLLMTAEFTATTPVTYDDCEYARSIACGDTVMGDTLSATVDAVEDCDPGTPDAPGVWYKWEDTSGFEANVSVTTCSANTDYDTQITVYTGPDCSNLTCVTSNDDDPNCTNFQSTAEFVSDGNSTYFIMVHGFNGAVGNFELSMNCTLIPPDNDMIENAIDLDEVDCPFTDEDVAMPAATTENGNPTDCDITGANGVWYKFTPAGDGEIFGTIVSPAGAYSVTFYTAPDENASETDLVLVDYWNNQCVEGQDEASIPYVAGQSYYCFVLNTGGRTDITFTGCENLGTTANTIEGFAYYPNPANDRLNLSSVENIENVAIYNILGQKVIDLNVDATTTQIDVSRLSVGAYIMKVSSNGQTGTYKVIKK